MEIALHEQLDLVDHMFIVESTVTHKVGIGRFGPQGVRPGPNQAPHLGPAQVLQKVPLGQPDQGASLENNHE